MYDPIIVLLLPIVFMVHEFEELILFPSWITKHKKYLKQRYPNLYSTLNLEDKLSFFQTPAFIIAVFEEFLLITTGTLLTIILDQLIYWYFCLLAFTLHFIGHLLLPILLKRFVPAITTTFLCLPYCIWAIHSVHNRFSPAQQIIIGLTSLLFFILNLRFVQKFSPRK